MVPEVSIVVIDTNILFSALLNDQSQFARTLLGSEIQFYVCELVLVELFSHADKVIAYSSLSDRELTHFYHTLLRHLHIFKEDLITPQVWAEAFELCKDIDETDTPHVALALQLGGLLWTGDEKLRNGLKKKGFDRFFTFPQTVVR